MIVGAGPAGSTAGVLLARAGWDVTIVEQSRFPRDKVCGECLSALGYDVLIRLGLAEELKQLGAIRLDRCEIHAPSGRSLVVKLPEPMWGISRHALDGMLLDAARGAGAVVHQPVRCESVTTTDHREPAFQAAGAAQRSPGSARAVRVTEDPGLRCAPHPACRRDAPTGAPRLLLRMRDLTTNRVETRAPSHVILADGKAAFATTPPTPTGDFGIKTHFAGIDGPRDRIELFGVRGSYGGLAPIEGGRWNAAFSVPASRLKAARGDLDALFVELTSENPSLNERLRGARRIGPWLASPLPRFPVQDHWHANVTPVGNAAAALEPIGGEGMGLAMRSAELAAQRLIASAGVRGSTGQASLADEYRRLWRTRRAGCRAAAVVVSSRLISGLLGIGTPPVPIVRAALQLMGK
jgi:flavin-dependent dehydrogenase